jgi:hypothetical protein
LSGGGINFSQPFEMSPHRSGRHNNNIIRQKTSTEWSLSTFINIAQKQTANISLDSLFSASIDKSIRLLWEAMLGRERDLKVDGVTSNGDNTDGGIYKYDSASDPSATFTMFENLDHMAKQAIGCFVNQVEISLPGDGQSQLNWSGNAKTVYHAGIGRVKAVTAAVGDNVISFEDGDEALRFDVGSLVMFVKNSDGITRATDTVGAPRKVLSSTTSGRLTAVDVNTAVVGKSYEIADLGDTTQADWNILAGTTGITYAVGNVISVASTAIADGTGTVKEIVGQVVVDGSTGEVDPRNFDPLLGWREALGY